MGFGRRRLLQVIRLFRVQALRIADRHEEKAHHDDRTARKRSLSSGDKSSFATSSVPAVQTIAPSSTTTVGVSITR
jgi:hypothetical protein